MPFFEISCTNSCTLWLPVAAIPSIVWMGIFLISAQHRERLGNITRIAIWGVAMALPVLILELAAQEFLSGPTPPFIIPVTAAVFAYVFVGISFVEEAAKYLVVRTKAMGMAFFTEPQDAVLYMVAAALGFAAIENLVYAALTATSPLSVAAIVAQRGLTATSLHVAASATVGYFLALSFSASRGERIKFLAIGLALATLLHGIYNTFIINIESTFFLHEGNGVSMLFSWSLVGMLLLLSLIIVLVAFRALPRIPKN